MTRILLPKITRITSPAKRVPRNWKEEGSIYLRLPEFYRKAYLESRKRIPKPIHYKPEEKKYEVHNTSGTK